MKYVGDQSKQGPSQATCPLDNSKVTESIQPDASAPASPSSSPLYQPSRSPTPPLTLVE